MKRLADSITRNTLLFLRAKFASNESWPYLEDEEQTSIRITDSYTINLSSPKLPMVAVERVVFDNSHETINQTLSYNLRTDERLCSTLVRCAIIIKCVSRSGIEATNIANEVNEYINAGRRLLMVDYGFHVIYSVSIGNEKILEAGADIEVTMVPVTVRAAVQDYWISSPPHPGGKLLDIKIKRINVGETVIKPTINGGS